MTMDVFLRTEDYNRAQADLFEQDARRRLADAWENSVRLQLPDLIGETQRKLSEAINPPPIAPIPVPTASPTATVTPPRAPVASLGAGPTQAPASQGMAGGAGDLRSYARQAAQRAGIDPELFARQIQQESGFDPNAGSPAGARGIAQIMPNFHPGVDTSDPYASLDYAANLMASHIKRYGGDMSKALAAYNAGVGAVQKYGGVPPFEETQRYVSTILGGAKDVVVGAAKSVLPNSAALDKPTPAAPSLSQFGDQTLTAEEAAAACGPAAAARLAATYGNSIPLSAALAAAKTVGWTSQGGMNGIGNQKRLLDALGVPAELDTSRNWDRITSEAGEGRMVTISTPGHYFSAQGTRRRADGQTELYVGSSGTDLKGGKAWMTPAEIESRMGTLNGALFSDPSRMVAAGEWGQQAASVAGVPPESEASAFADLERALSTVRDFAGEALSQAQAGMQRNPYLSNAAGGGIVSRPADIAQGVGRFFEGVGTDIRRQQREAQATNPYMAGVAGGGFSDVSTALTAGLERAGVPGHEQAGFSVGPLQVGPREVLGSVPEIALPSGAVKKLAPEAAEQAIRGVSKIPRRLPAEAEAGFAAGLPTGGRRPPPPTFEPHGLTINLPKYTPPEVRDVITQAYESRPELMDAARRGVVPDDVVRDLAEQVGVRKSQIVSLWKPGQAKNAETIYALRQALADQATQVRSAQQALRAAADPGAQATALRTFTEALARHASVQEVVTGVTAEAGRALRQFRQPVTGQEAAMRYLQRVARANKVQPDALAALLANADLSNPGQVVSLARTMLAPSKMDKLLAWTTSNMLSGTKSLEINAVGGAIETINRPLLELLGGRPQDAFDDLAAMGRAVGRAWGQASHAFMTGERVSRLEEVLDETGKLDLMRPQAFAGKQGLIATPALRIFGATDEFVKVLNAAGGSAVEARRIARETGQTVADVLNDPQHAERIHEAGLAAGRVATFEDEASPLARLLLRGRNLAHEPGVGNRATGLAFNVLTPFVRIPDVILRRGTGMVTAPITETVRGVAALRGGRSEAARTHFAKAAQSTLLTAAILGEIAAGNITGNGPDNPDKRRVLEAARDENGNPIWQAHSIRVGDRWLDYTNLGPASVPFAIWSSVAEAWSESQARPERNVLVEAMDKTASTLLDASYVRSIGDIFKAVNDGRLGDIASSTAGNVLTRFVPYGGAVAQLTRGTDPEQKQPRNPLEQVMARVPGLSETVPSRVDRTTGRAAQAPQDLPAMLMPFRTSAAGESNAVARVLAEHDLSVGGPPDRLAATKSGKYQINLTDHEKRRYEEIYGEQVNARISAVLADHTFNGLPDQRKRAVLQAQIEKARGDARLRLLSEIPGKELNSRAEADSMLLAGSSSARRSPYLPRSEPAPVQIDNNSRPTQVSQGQRQPLTPEQRAAMARQARLQGNLLLSLALSYPMLATAMGYPELAA